jgi:hypothetical protein
MKINVEVDCTPEEARAALGLPDLTPVHDKYVALISGAMEGNFRPDMVENLFRSWAPMNEAGMAFWRNMLDAGKGSGG